MSVETGPQESDILDRNGDTVVVLWKATSVSVYTPGSESHSSDASDLDAPMGEDVVPLSQDNQTPYLFKVSRAVMVDNFPYARAVLESVFPNPPTCMHMGYFLVPLERFSVAAVRTGLLLAHGWAVDPPSSRDEMADIALFAQDMNCEQLFHPIVCQWIGLREAIGDQPSSDLAELLDMGIASVFPVAPLLRPAVMTVLRNARGPIEGGVLPLRRDVIEWIEEKRLWLLTMLKNSVHALFEQIRDYPLLLNSFPEQGCSYNHHEDAYHAAWRIISTCNLQESISGQMSYTVRSILEALNYVRIDTCPAGRNCIINTKVKQIQSSLTPWLLGESFWDGYPEEWV